MPLVNELRASGTNPRLRRLVGLVCALLGLGVAACASTERSPAGEADVIPSGEPTVVGENTVSPGSSLSVQLESSTGDRTILGSVGPRRTESFQLGEVQHGVSYRLIAGVTGGTEIASERFTLEGVSEIRWTLPYNRLRTKP